MRLIGWLQKCVERPWQVALLLWVGSLAVRILFYVFFLTNNPCQLFFDSGHYHAMACNLLERGAFCDVTGLYNFYRLPGYPVFLATCYWLFGVVPGVALAVQQLLGACIPVQMFFFVRMLWPKPWWGALVIAAIGIFHVGLVLFSGLVMTETLFVFCFLVFLQLLVSMWRTRKCHQALFAGLTLGICNLTRPLVFFPIVVAVLCFIFMQGRWQQRVLLVGNYSIGWLVLLAYWIARNWAITGLCFLHTLSGPHLLNHGAVRAYAMAHNLPCEQARIILHKQVPSIFTIDKQQHAVLKSRGEEQLAKKTLLMCWPQTIILSLVNCLKTVLGLYSAELLCIDSGGDLPSYNDSCSLWQRAQRFLRPRAHNRLIWYICWLEIVYQCIILFGVCGYCLLWLLSRRKDWLMAMLLALCVTIVAATAICGFARLRLPIEPILIMVAVMFYVRCTCGKEIGNEASSGE